MNQILDPLQTTIIKYLGNTSYLYETENDYIFYVPQITSCVLEGKCACNSSANTQTQKRNLLIEQQTNMQFFPLMFST